MVGVEYPPGALWPLLARSHRAPTSSWPRRGCRMRQGLISLLGTWGRSNQGELEACRRELSESLEREKATSQVLGIISGSPSDLEVVFEAMLANATRICEAKFGNLFLREGNGFRSVAMHAVPSTYAE